MSDGESRSRVNYAFAIYNAFKKMNSMKFPEDYSPKDTEKFVPEDDEIVEMEDEGEEER